MKRICIPAALLSILAMSAAGCGGDGNPVAPSAAISQSDSAAATSDVRSESALTGLVTNLNWRARTFTLVAGRTGALGASRLIHFSDRTEFMTGDRRVRPRTLENGAAVEVHGSESGGEFLAAKIVVLRRRGR
jgi:hypothetical protein